MSITADEAIFKRPLFDCLYKATEEENALWSSWLGKEQRKIEKLLTFTYVNDSSSSRKQTNKDCLCQRKIGKVSKHKVAQLINFRMTSMSPIVCFLITLWDSLEIRKENLLNVWPQLKKKKKKRQK